ncbi:hypothetical protein [Streptococcus pluranimalium]|nr:hypothetical protein [Streptococcus pluranimalium]
MNQTNDFDKEVIAKCLDVMSFTTRNLEQDFKAAISETSQNGIFQNVWGRRSDMLRDLFKNSSI